MRNLWRPIIIVSALALGGCSFLPLDKPTLFDQSELPGWYVSGNEAVADGICRVLTAAFGGC